MTCHLVLTRLKTDISIRHKTHRQLTCELNRLEYIAITSQKTSKCTETAPEEQYKISAGAAAAAVDGALQKASPRLIAEVTVEDCRVVLVAGGHAAMTLAHENTALDS